jgi:hypothetical protein
MRITLTCVAVLFLLSAGTANANLIVNGGFETGDFTGWTLTGATENGVDYGISTDQPYSGMYSAWFGAVEGMTYLSQSISTTPGQTYAASFWAAMYNEGDESQNEIQVFWNGTDVLDASDVPAMPWTFVSDTFTATSSSTEVTFGFNNVPGWFVLDNVDIEPAPEPQASILCGLGIGLICLLRRGAVNRRQAR